MGLDAYLFRNEIDPETHEHEELAYWRKFNALHNWVTSNFLPEGEDDNCNYIYIPREKLEELLEGVRQSVEAEAPYVKPFLSPMSGFFFGSTDIDEYYWVCCQELVAQLTKALAKYPEDKEFIYYAWY